MMSKIKKQFSRTRAVVSAETPLRSEILTREGLAEYAHVLAEGHRVTRSRRGPSAVIKRFEENILVLEQMYVALSDAAEQKGTLSSGAAWFLDNYHIIQEQVRDIRRDFPRGYYRSLPKLTGGQYQNFPRVYHIALELIMHTDATIDQALVGGFVASYQANSVLTSGELWAIPIMLRVALIENLRRLMLNTLQLKEQSLQAEALVDEIVGPAAHSSTDLLLMLASKLNEHPEFLPAGAVSLMRRLRGEGAKSALTLQWLETRLREQGHDPDEMARIEQYSQAANQASIGNSVTSLKQIEEINWQNWFEGVSFVHSTLAEDPANAYLRCDFNTRDQYRHRIETLARRISISEVAVAQATVELASRFDSSSQTAAWIDDQSRTVAEQRSDEEGQQRFRHVGYYLIGKGQRELEQQLGCKRSLREMWSALNRRYAFFLYSSSIIAITIALISWVLALLLKYESSWSLAVTGALLCMLPLSELASNLVQWFETNTTTPSALPKLDFESSIPLEFSTVVTIQTIFHDREAVTRTVEGLEVRYLANDDPNLHFAILADLGDAGAEELPEDEELLAHAERLVLELNQRHFPGQRGRFALLFRRRTWNQSQRLFMGWERKRGKIQEFNRLLLGETTTAFRVHVGSLPVLRTMKFVITLDGDSTLPRGTARKLIGALAHPLNRPTFDPVTRMVREGYAIIQPRVSVGLVSSTASRFTKLFSGASGLDPYTQLVSDVYQDLFAEGSYIGKGIYDLVPFKRALRGRVPDDTMLSHDLFEGCFARVALATDIEIFDDFPSRYDLHTKRLSRWVRGDWQLLPWIGGSIPDSAGRRYPSPLSLLDKWKLGDNLRRSLIAPSWFLFLGFSLLFLPNSTLLSAALLGIVVGFPVLATAANALMGRPQDLLARGYARGLVQDITKQSWQALLTIAFLPYQAYLMSSSILTTLFRMWVTKTNLLEWEPADHAEKRMKGSARSFFERMAPGLLLVALLAVLVAVTASERQFTAMPLLVLWLSSPYLAYRLSTPLASTKSSLTVADRSHLLRIAWETWQYFEQLMNADHHFLAPDNIQLEPRRIVAERTSPTNISLSILSVISAYDLGFISLPNAVDRLEKIFSTLDKLERFRGHFLNWYQTRTLASLLPRYVSTVDSGNLVGHLIAARAAFIQFQTAPLVNARHWQHLTDHLTAALAAEDHAAAIEQVLDRAPSTEIEREDWKRAAIALRSTLQREPHNFRLLLASLVQIRSFVRSVAVSETAELQTLSRPNSELHQCLVDLELLLELESLLSWFTPLETELVKIDAILATSPDPLLNEVRKTLQEVRALSCDTPPTPAALLLLAASVLRLIAQLEPQEQGRALPVALLYNLREIAIDLELSAEPARQTARLAEAAGKIVEEIELGFLYDEEKELFAIGYHVESGQRDRSYYDLLASESRLASLVAIASGKVPQKHWFSLGRTLVAVPGSTALVSWTGTMFEYLMPLLVMRDFAGTLLTRTSTAVVNAQREYTALRGIPWGISESAYGVMDFEKTYQYKAFGLPSLGLKRGLGDDLVVSPYSTFLALLVDPAEALKNLAVLEGLGMRGEFGFFEAIDYTAERMSAEETSHIVRTFMAHHQAMTIVAINNALQADIMVERFHSDPRIRATELLLQEKFPRSVSIVEHIPGEPGLSEVEEEEQRISRAVRITSPHGRHPRTRILSNGRYTIMVDDAGNGFSTYGGDLMLTRWREDGIAGKHGSYIFVRDVEDGKLWSVAYQPTRVEPDSYEVLFNPDKIEFIRRDSEILLHTEITVSPEDNVEVRRVTLTNMSKRKRTLEITSYAEVALAFARADLAHPAFSKMFIETEYLQEFDALVFARRPRSQHEERMFLVHMLTQKSCWVPTQYETSRALFLGRGNSIGEAQVFGNQHQLSGTTGAVLDPVFSLRAHVELGEGETQVVVFTTGFAKTREELMLLTQRYRDYHSISRAFEMAWSHNNIELRQKEFSVRQVHGFQKLLSAIVYNIDSVRGPAASQLGNRLRQSSLWRFGVSGDLPIVLLRVNDSTQIDLAQELLLAHHYSRARAILFDLVIINEFPGGYLQNFQEELEFLVRSGNFGGVAEQRGGVYLRTLVQLAHDEVLLLEAIARVVLSGERGSLASQLRFGVEPAEPINRRRAVRATSPQRLAALPKLLPSAATSYEFFNGLGGFTDKGRSYQIELDGSQLAPLPWSNIIANPHFGFSVSESGAGYTWSENSRENKLTPWRNDPVTDAPGEVLYLRDIAQGEYWSPTPRPILSAERFEVRHSFGYSEFSTSSRGIDSLLTLSGSATERVKWWQLKLVNRTDRLRRLEAYLYVEWALGVERQDSVRTLVTGFDAQGSILHACNHYNNEFAGRVVSLGSSEPIRSYTTSREEFIGRHNDTATPTALDSAGPRLLAGRRPPLELSRKVGSGFDSCGVLKIQFELEPLEERDVLFFLSESNSMEDARRHAVRFRSPRVRTAELATVKQSWDSVLGAIQVTTPDRAFDVLINGWLLYQTLSCRINGRSALYQSGGAMGFRDQLQDVLSLLYSRPDLARAQILIHAAHQFPEGDVQHWWHPPTGRGVRTRISDDYLWLPFVVERYLKITGDHGILEEQVPFVDAPRLDAHQMEAYIVPTVSNRTATLYEHCILSLDRAIAPETAVGTHGLPLMGAGDWNDGMNEVGSAGRGESVWLGWFLSECLSRFAATCDRLGDAERATVYQEAARSLVDSIEQHAWDGQWYLRAFFDDGTPLGSSDNSECKIDSLSQSWSVIVGTGSKDRSAQAMDSVRRELVRPKEKLISLLTPPFDQGPKEPGYIKGYVPGVRENGGQYTHAAAWVVMATAMQGKGSEAFDLFSLVNPINHSSDPTAVETYKGEPYVLCGDVYSAEPHTGRAGWSWYTGSAGWMYQVGIEHILGLKVNPQFFSIDPCIPASWNEFSMSYRAKNVLYEIQVLNPKAVERGVETVWLGERQLPDTQIPFVAETDSKIQTVTVIMG